jgi:endonuclease YncB( thermonuclease family)
MRRFLRKWLAILLLLGCLFVWLFPELMGLAGPQTRSADGDKVAVRDGDTMRIGDQDYRLHGIDAPEFTQICKDEKGKDWPCGKLARAELLSLVKGRTLTCEERAHDKYQRIVATCRDEEGRDLARAMAEKGMAISFGGFAEGPYADEEAAAKKAKRGLWQGAFDLPSSWRATHPKSNKAPAK